MFFTQVVMDVFCFWNQDKDENSSVPDFCIRGIGDPGFHCLANLCQHVAFSKGEDEIAFSNHLGEIESQIGFGNEMEPVEESQREMCLNSWKEICIQKIEEAYTEYMKRNDSNILGLDNASKAKSYCRAVIRLTDK